MIIVISKLNDLFHSETPRNKAVYQGCKLLWIVRRMLNKISKSNILLEVYIKNERNLYKWGSGYKLLHWNVQYSNKVNCDNMKINCKQLWEWVQGGTLVNQIFVGSQHQTDEALNLKDFVEYDWPR